MNQPAQQPTVLLVDDDELLLTTLAEALSPYFRTDQARSAKEAEALLKVRNYKVIVSDHNMPGGRGLDFLTRVRKQYPNTVRLLLTSHLSPDLMKSLGQADPYRYLLKPISLADLLRALQDAMQHHDQNPPGP